jgi:glycosyltransferase involved in cell wall biosynthesis
VRQTMSRWEVNRDIRLVAWTEDGGAMRALTPVQHRRVTAWNTPPEPRGLRDDPNHDHVLVVPFESVVVLPEVPQLSLCDPLAALAEFSGNKTGLVGYDAIPVVSADMVPDAETERFVRYLTIVKHSHRVAGISVAATAEFAGFGDAVEAQGLTPPTTVEITLPIALPDEVSAERTTPDDVPLVLCVGSQEARKNHLAVLFAAEMLWREGLEFRLRFIGGGSLAFIRTFDRRVAALRRQGRRIEVLRGVDDSVLVSSYAEARFTVFPSLHEGYGLPVAESLARGVPVVTSDYGSTAEIAVDGGCLTVDPRDDDALVDAMRSLIVDETVLERLRAECRARPVRTWDTYADELWDGLVVPLQEGSDV